MPPRPKPARVRLSGPLYRQLVGRVFAQTDGLCGCGCGRRATSAHHLLGGIYREDVLSNMIGLAGDGTRLCHGALTSGNLADGIHPRDVCTGIRTTLESYFPEKIDYIVALKGPDFLERAYPSRDAVCAELDCWELEPCPLHGKERPSSSSQSSSPPSVSPLPRDPVL